MCVYTFSVDFLREDTMIGTSFLRVAAHDDDYGSYAAVTYSMSKEQPEYLQVNPVTGWVYVNEPISQVSPLPITRPTAHRTYPPSQPLCTKLRSPCTGRGTLEGENISKHIYIQLACSCALPSGAELTPELNSTILGTCQSVTHSVTPSYASRV